MSTGIMKVGLAMLLASLSSSLNLKRPSGPVRAPVVIIKADDLTDPSSANWQAFFQTVQALDIQASVGIIAKSFVATPENIARMQALRDSGAFEFWNHGYDHASFAFPTPAADATAQADFDGDLIPDALTNADGRLILTLSATGQTVTYGDKEISAPQAAHADYDADGKTDISVVTQDRKWLIDYSADGFGRWDLEIPPPRNADPPLTEFWNAGKPPSDNPAPYNPQFDHLTRTQEFMNNRLGIPSRAFGSPFNRTDPHTREALARIPDIKVWMCHTPTERPAASTSQTILRFDTLIEAWGPYRIDAKPIRDKWTTKFSKLPYLVIQLHPANWDNNNQGLIKFQEMVGFLKGKGARFMTPYQYYSEQNFCAKNRELENPPAMPTSHGPCP